MSSPTVRVEVRQTSADSEFIDHGVSGVKERRPALDALLAAAKGRKIDVVACIKLDRLARSTHHLGSETGRVLFLYTPAAAGGYIEELLNCPGPINDDERNKLRERYRWEVVGPNPL
jgi:hypothetical protein